MTDTAAEILLAGAAFNYDLARSLSILKSSHHDSCPDHLWPEECPTFRAWDSRRIGTDGLPPSADPEPGGHVEITPDGFWVSTGLLTTDQVEAAHKELADVQARGETTAVIDGHLWVWHKR